ncbi:hypothetical protein BH11PSE2_BH11PSE2_09470 [soil metagenome]
MKFPAAAAAERSPVGQTLAGLKVLVVDDDTAVRAVTVAMVGDLGCMVDDLDTGEAALNTVEIGAYDVVLIDFAMPGINGGETARRLTERDPGLAIVLMSGYAESASLAQDWPGPVLHKPFGAAGLAARISDLLHARASARGD